MQNVWVLFEDYGYDGYEVIGVYDTEAKANAALEELVRATRRNDWDFEVKKFDVQ